MQLAHWFFSLAPLLFPLLGQVRSIYTIAPTEQFELNAGETLSSQLQWTAYACKVDNPTNQWIHILNTLQFIPPAVTGYVVPIPSMDVAGAEWKSPPSVVQAVALAGAQAVLTYYSYELPPSGSTLAVSIGTTLPQLVVTGSPVQFQGGNIEIDAQSNPTILLHKTGAPVQDWIINGGATFSIQDGQTLNQVFDIAAGAPGNSILINTNGLVAFARAGQFGTSIINDPRLGSAAASLELAGGILTQGVIVLTTNDAYIALYDNDFAINLQAGGPRPAPLHATSTLTFPDLALGGAVPASGFLLASVGTNVLGHGVKFADAYGAMQDCGYAMSDPSVTTLTTSGLASIGGHIKSTAGAPTLGALQAGVSSQSIAGTDAACRVSVTTAGAGAPGIGAQLAVVTFAATYTVQPVGCSDGDIGGNNDAGGTPARLSTDAWSASGFDVFNSSQHALAISTTYKCNVIAVGL